MNALKVMKTVLGALLVAAVALVAIDQTRGVVDACSIAWSTYGGANPTLQANSSGNFGNSGTHFEMDTSTVISGSEDPFDLNLGFTMGSSTNIANCTVTPSYFAEVGTANSLSHLYGLLSNPGANGEIVISAWDSEDWACSAEHRRTVLHG